jgi:hypothetical protein
MLKALPRHPRRQPLLHLRPQRLLPQYPLHQLQQPLRLWHPLHL